MSVLTFVWLDCNGCRLARFIPDPANGNTPEVRKLAEAAGWAPDWRRTGKDYCPACAKDPSVLNPKQSRGICHGCNTEQVVTLAGKVKQHRVRNMYGGTSPCAGGGHAPVRVVRRAAPRGPEWKSLI